MGNVNLAVLLYFQERGHF